MNLATMVDKERVRRSFSRQASVYEENAPMQRAVAERLISMIPLHSITHHPSPVTLDIGIGTGFAVKPFQARFPKAAVFGCDLAWGMLKEARGTGAILAEADAENLPYRDGVFDLVFSSLAFQWTDLARSMAEGFRVLRPGGRIYISTFGEETLTELAGSYEAAMKRHGITHISRSMRFHSRGDIRDIIESAGFSDVKVEREIMRSRYPSTDSLLRSLKTIGAGNPSKDLHPSRTLLNETYRIYRERYGDADGITATFEVVYASGVKG